MKKFHFRSRLAASLSSTIALASIAFAQPITPANNDLDTFSTTELNKRIYCAQNFADLGALSDMSGFAKVAGTTGGESTAPNILWVKNYADSGVHSLRDAIANAGQASGGGVVRFLTTMNGETIRLESSIFIPSNVTIDGTCVDVRIESRVNVGTFRIRGESNIIIRNLELSQYGQHVIPAVPASQELRFYDKNSVLSRLMLNNLQPGQQSTKDIISIYTTAGGQWPDKIFISNNSFQNCGDECVGINFLHNVAPASPNSNITVSYNHFENSRRALLISSGACKDGNLLSGSNLGNHIGCDHFENTSNTSATANEARDILVNSPIKLTLEGNVFLGVENRMPRVSYGVFVHSVGNLFIPRRIIDRAWSIYAVTEAGVLFSEKNILINSYAFSSNTSLNNLQAYKIATTGLSSHPDNPANPAAGRAEGDAISSGIDDSSSSVNFQYNNNSTYVADPSSEITNYAVTKPDLLTNNVRDVMECMLAVAGPDPLIKHNKCHSF